MIKLLDNFVTINSEIYTYPMEIVLLINKTAHSIEIPLNLIISYNQKYLNHMHPNRIYS
jgi:hypothetical protein